VMNAPELLQTLSKDLADLPRRDEARLDRLVRRTEMVIRRVFGENSKYLTDLKDIRFYPIMAPADEQYKASAWTSGVEQFRNLLDTMAEELTLAAPDASQGSAAPAESRPPQKRIFVVHGRDDEMKQSVARTLEKVGLTAVILHEQPNQGRTIIEKFAEYASAAFAVVLLSGDDSAHERNETRATARPRPRQNVVFELGYFLGKLGRDRVFALYREVANFEMPSDYSGVVFTPYDAGGRWQLDLIKELKAAGYEVDANRIL
jgi:predicted nucleotide-binding protein